MSFDINPARQNPGKVVGVEGGPLHPICVDSPCVSAGSWEAADRARLRDFPPLPTQLPTSSYLRCICSRARLSRTLVFSVRIQHSRAARECVIGPGFATGVPSELKTGERKVSASDRRNCLKSLLALVAAVRHPAAAAAAKLAVSFSLASAA